IAGRALAFYVGKLLWPYPQVFFYPRWVINSWSPLQYLYPLGVLGLLAALWAWRARIGRGPLAAALIFAGVLVPALGFFSVYPFRYSFVADHYQYHASIALFALAAAAIALLIDRLGERGRRLAPLAAAALLVPLMVVAHLRTHAFADDLVLDEDIVAKN